MAVKSGQRGRPATQSDSRATRLAMPSALRGLPPPLPRPGRPLEC
jgi:hypothetical protein